MTHENPQEETDFGFERVKKSDKTHRVAAVFESVAEKYDVMNDLMSFGMHRWWKKVLLQKANPRPGQIVLDVAAGTGDITLAFSKAVGPTGRVIMSDINPAMLAVGQDRLANAGQLGNVEYCVADAENLPFEDDYFDYITIGFGLRNVTDKSRALTDMYRVLKPGGKLFVLEFSKPSTKLLQKCYDLYSFHVIPTIGKLVANDADSYQYLVESIRKHPQQDILADLMRAAEFEDVSYDNLTGGIVALHTGCKY